MNSSCLYFSGGVVSCSLSRTGRPFRTVFIPELPAHSITRPDCLQRNTSCLSGRFPPITMNPHSTTRNTLHPVAWRLYRAGLVAVGLVWICIATTLCGCSAANGWAKNQYGRRQYNHGNYAAARAEFERALLDDPYNATYAYNVGKAMEKEGDISGAEKMYQHALTLDPSHQPAYHGLSELLASQGRENEAFALLTAWSQTQPYSAASHVELANLYRKTGNLAAAEQELNTALQIRPRFRQALNERSRLYQITGRPDPRPAPYSALALTPPASQMATLPNSNVVAATPETSPALNMAATMPQKDPTLMNGVIQASYSNPQMAGITGPMAPAMSSSPMMSQAPLMPQAGIQVHQTHMNPAAMTPTTPVGGWNAVAHQAGPGVAIPQSGTVTPMGMPFQTMAMMPGQVAPQYLPSQAPQMIPQPQPFSAGMGMVTGTPNGMSSIPAAPQMMPTATVPSGIVTAAGTEVVTGPAPVPPSATPAPEATPSQVVPAVDEIPTVQAF